MSLFKKKHNTQPLPRKDDKRKSKAPAEIVLGKFKAMEDFKDALEDDLKESSQILVDAERLQTVYFEGAQEVIQETRSALTNSAKTRNKWRVKLILTNLELNPVAKVLGVMAHATLRKFKFGLVHAALQVGHVMLEWNDKSLVIPQDINEYPGYDTLIAIDLDQIEQADIKLESVQRICETIVTWNTEKEYSVTNCNCQHFVDAILTALGIEAVFDGAIGQFMKLLQNTSDPDKVEFRFPPIHDQDGEASNSGHNNNNNSNNNTTHNHSRKYIFHSHAELDEACYELEREGNLTPQDRRLLKAYDRVFWFRFYSVREGTSPNTQAMSTEEKYKYIKKYQPSSNECFFGNPRESGTM